MKKDYINNDNYDFPSTFIIGRGIGVIDKSFVFASDSAVGAAISEFDVNGGKVELEPSPPAKI